MGERTSYPQGTPSWVDLMTGDPEGARAFYGGLFGWEFEIDPNPETMNYTVCRLNGRRVAGMGGQPAPAGMPTVWTTYFAVDDVDKVVEAIAEHGGNVQMAPIDVMGQGRMAVAADREGASFGLWQAGATFGAELVNVPGTVVWNELTTRDLDGGTGFYGEVLAQRWEDFDTGDSGVRYRLAYAGDRVVAGALDMGTNFPPEMPPFWAVYFAVEDAAASAARAVELGGAIQVPVFDTPQGPTAVLRDPQGGSFSVIAMIRADD